MNKLALSILACGYLCRVYTDARRPVFVPLWNYAFNQGGPDPDYVYSTTEIDRDGVLSHLRFRGVAFRRDHQQAFDMMAPAHGRWHAARGHARPRRRDPGQRRLLQRRAQAGTAVEPQRRLVAARSAGAAS